jgi:PAS domain S-box-containing protein
MQRRILSYLKNIWRALFKPTFHTNSRVTHQQVETLSVLAFVFCVVNLFIIVFKRLIGHSAYWFESFFFVILAGYVLSRTRFYRWGIVLWTTLVVILPLYRFLGNEAVDATDLAHYLTWSTFAMFIAYAIGSPHILALTLIAVFLGVAALFQFTQISITESGYFIAFPFTTAFVLFTSSLITERHRRRQQAEIDEMTRRFDALAEHAPNAVVIHNCDRFLYANAATVELFGAKNREAVLALKPIEMIIPEQRQIAVGRMQYMRETRLPTPPQQYRMIGLDGHYRDIELTGVPIRYQNQDAVQLVVRDITQKLADEREMRLLKQAMEHLHDGVLIVDLSGDPVSVLYANAAFAAQVQQDISQIISQPVDKLASLISQQRFAFDDIISKLQQGQIVRMQTRLEVEETHSISYFDWSIVPIRDNDTVTKAVFVQRDISAIEEVELKLRTADYLIQSVFRIAPVGIAVMDDDGRYIDANPEYSRITDFAREDIIGKHYNEILSAQNTSTYNRLYRRIEADETIPSMVTYETIPHADGQILDVRSNISLLNQPNNQRHFVTVSLDISDQKQAERNLQRYAEQQAILAYLSERALSLAVDENLLQETTLLLAATLNVEYSGFYQCDPQKQAYVLAAGAGWNDDAIGYHALKMGVGDGDQTFQSRSTVIVDDLLTETRFKPDAHLLEYGIRSSITITVEQRGEILGILGAFSTEPGHFEEQDAYFITAVGAWISAYIERKEIDDELRRLNALLEQRVTARTAQLQMILDSTGEGIAYLQRGEIDYINPALCAMTGYDASELIGQDFARLIPQTPQEETDTDVFDSNMFNSPLWRGELKIEKKDGTIIDAGLTLAQIDADRTMSGERSHVAVLRDISQEKAIEEQKKRFLDNASHELRTPITNLSTRLYLMRRQPEKMGTHLEVLDRVESRMRYLVEDLLDISRIQNGRIHLNKETTDLTQFMREIIEVQQSEAERNDIKMISAIPEEPIYADIDKQRFTQVIVNLITNSIRYTSAEGTIRMWISPTSNGKTVQIHVKDDGIGIPPEHMDSIFQPFYRVRDDNRGTGLGLSISQEIVHAHNGEIAVESAIGLGSTFTVTLPLADA